MAQCRRMRRAMSAASAWSAARSVTANTRSRDRAGSDGASVAHHLHRLCGVREVKVGHGGGLTRLISSRPCAVARVLPGRGRSRQGRRFRRWSGHPADIPAPEHTTDPTMRACPETIYRALFADSLGRRTGKRVRIRAFSSDCLRSPLQLVLAGHSRFDPSTHRSTARPERRLNRNLPCSGALLVCLEEAQLPRRIRHQKVAGLLAVRASRVADLRKTWPGMAR
jgi:hypothetical protein